MIRTDRTLVFYENKNNDAKLWDILSIYAWVDKDIGYCQGKWAVDTLMEIRACADVNINH